MSNISPTPRWTLDVPFEARMWASHHGARWNGPAQCWVYEGHSLPPMLEPFRSLPFSFEWNRQFYLNGRHLEIPTRLEPFYTPRPHQKEAIEIIQSAQKQKSPGFLLADEVGVGKTLSAWGFALQASQLSTILIVTTSSAQAHWRQSVLHAGWNRGQSILIINYDRLGKLFEIPEDGLTSTRKKGKRKRIAKQGQAPAFDLVIFDESHKGKNPDSARGLMMRKITQKSQFTLWTSATAGQDPIELVYLASLLAFSTKSKVPGASKEEFTEWCVKQGLQISKGAYGKIIWEQNDDDLEKIHSWLFKGKHPVALRRRPEEIAGWKAMERALMPVGLSFEARQSYTKLWEDFVKEEMQLKTSPSSASQRQAVEANRLRLRQQSSWLRIPSTLDFVKDAIDNGRHVAISVAFRQTQDELLRQLEQAGFSTAFIHGQLSPTEKERQRLLFQKDQAQVVVFTVEDAISLHQGEYKEGIKPRLLLVHDIRWSAIQMAQIEGRCHRDGTFAPTWWLAGEDTVDIGIAETMVNRVAGMKAMHGDSVQDLKAIEEVLKRYIDKSLLTHNPPQGVQSLTT